MIKSEEERLLVGKSLIEYQILNTQLMKEKESAETNVDAKLQRAHEML